jgi:uncharacterized protein (DUF1697 family)
VTAARRVVALLRGINVGGNRKLPMADLRELAAGLGWRDVATYVQSGNLVGAVAAAPPAVGRRLERALAEHCGFAVAVVVRDGAAFANDVAACPFADEAPAQVHFGACAMRPAPSLPRDLAAYCAAGERVAVIGDALWIHFASGVARSKLTSAVLDRAVGGTVTLRNLTSARAIAALVAGGEVIAAPRRRR